MVSTSAISRVSRALALCSVTAGILLPTRSGLALEDPPIKLVWSSPRQCPQAAEVTARIHELAGLRQEPERIAALTARGVIEPAGEQYQLTLLIQDGATTGSRSISSTSCQSLGDAAAVVLSLLVRQRRELGRGLSKEELKATGAMVSAAPATRSEPEPKPESATTGGSSPPSTTPPEDDAEASRNALTGQTAKPNPKRTNRDEQPPRPRNAAPVDDEHAWRLLVAAPAIQLDFETLPQTSLGLSLGLGIAHRSYRAFATVALFEAQDIQGSSSQQYDARFLNRSASGWFCKAWSSSILQAAPCAQVTINRVKASASGSGIATRSEDANWLSLGGGLLTSIRFTRTIGLFARATGRINVTRPEFLLADDRWGQRQLEHSIHRIPFGTLELALGGEWLF